MRNTKFFESIGRGHPYEEEKWYCIVGNKMKLAMQIMTELILIAESDFYGCDLRVDGADAIMSIQLGSFYVDMLDAPERVISLLRQADELTFIPGDSHMTIQVRINGLFELREDDDLF